MSTPAAGWRYRLRGDPAPWLLDYVDNPSVYFWFQRDIVGRPEDAAALVQAREMVLYSAPVQQILSAQDAGGYWDNPDSLAAPRYSATLWQLALLAELGIPRNSRRARAACEFILEYHLTTEGNFTSLDERAATGLLLQTLLYFNYHDDPRASRALDALAASVPTSAPGAVVYALSALTEIPLHRRWPVIGKAIAHGEVIILDALARNEFSIFGAFPPFDERDALLALRVLATLGCASDPRANRMIERIWARQDDAGRWPLDHNLSRRIAVDLEPAGAPSKWATLNVLRIVTRV